MHTSQWVTIPTADRKPHTPTVLHCNILILKISCCLEKNSGLTSGARTPLINYWKFIRRSGKRWAKQSLMVLHSTSNLKTSIEHVYDGVCAGSPTMSESPQRNLALELVHVTEAAALVPGRL